MRERRQRRGAALRQQRFGKTLVIVGGERARQRMRRKIRLHDHLAGQFGAPRAARHLEQQRGEPLRRPEIAAVERIVGTQDADQREARKIVALGEHLGADEYVDVARVHAIADGGERALAPRAVAIDARDAGGGKAVGQRALEPLRAVAERQEVDVAALGTAARQPLDVAAVVAAQIRASRGGRRAARCSADSRPASRTRSTAATARTRAG